MSKQPKFTTKKAVVSSSTKRKRGSRLAQAATRASTTTRNGPESAGSSNTDETLSEGPTWADIAIPCRCLIRENNVEGVTDNPIIEAWLREATLNHDYMLEECMGWIKTSHYELVEYMGPLKEEDQDYD